jgi:hypothetical protein
MERFEVSHPVIRKVILATGLIVMWTLDPGAALSPSNAAHAAVFQAAPAAGAPFAAQTIGRSQTFRP